jgi:hypothetical protein
MLKWFGYDTYNAIDNQHIIKPTKKAFSFKFFRPPSAGMGSGALFSIKYYIHVFASSLVINFCSKNALIVMKLHIAMR